MSEIRVLIIEDEPLVANDIAATLRGIDYSVSGIAYSVEKARRQLDENRPDIVLLDINLGAESDGVALGELIRSRYELPFIYLSSYADKATVARAKSTLPMGYLVKPYSERELFAALEIAMFNFAHFQFPVQFNLEKFNSRLLSKITQKEFDILQELYDGKTNQQLAEQHFISLNTVKTHIKHLYDKLQVQTRSELMVLVRNILKD